MSKRYERNSSIELLRIIAMFMIVAAHSVGHNGVDLHSQPLTPTRFILQIVMQCGGIGLTVFFMISAWFFLDRDQDIKSCWKKIWIMERELLFWSILLTSLSYVFVPDLTSPKQLAMSVFPLLSSTWWYATSYAIFLLFLPFLYQGLKNLSRNMHKTLACTMLVLWGILMLVPGVLGGNVPGSNVFGFVYLFALMSYYKWHMKTLSANQAWILFGIGVFLLVGYSLATIPLERITGRTIFIDTSWRLPMLLIAFGAVVLCEKVNFYNMVINFIAASTFAVYLITEYPTVRIFLWKKHFLLDDLAYGEYGLLGMLVILLAIYVACICCDFFRRGLFGLTVDKHKNCLFEKFYDFLYNSFAKI